MPKLMIRTLNLINRNSMDKIYRVFLISARSLALAVNVWDKKCSPGGFLFRRLNT